MKYGSRMYFEYEDLRLLSESLYCLMNYYDDFVISPDKDTKIKKFKDVFNMYRRLVKEQNDLICLEFGFNCDNSSKKDSNHG